MPSTWAIFRCDSASQTIVATFAGSRPGGSGASVDEVEVVESFEVPDVPAVPPDEPFAVVAAPHPPRQSVAARPRAMTRRRTGGEYQRRPGRPMARGL